MSGESCRAWRGELAARALGHPDSAADAGLDAHLDGCAECRAELEELRAIAAAAALADPERLRTPAPTPALADRIVARVAEEAAATRRRRTGRLVLGVAGAAAAVAAMVLTLGLTGDDQGGARRIELTGSNGADGSAVLAARPWGTEITLEVSGLDQGEMYWLWLTPADGDRVIAGSLTGTGERARVVLASALPTDEARRIWMTDEADWVVLDADIDPG